MKLRCNKSCFLLRKLWFGRMSQANMRLIRCWFERMSQADMRLIRCRFERMSQADMRLTKCWLEALLKKEGFFYVKGSQDDYS